MTRLFIGFGPGVDPDKLRRVLEHNGVNVMRLEIPRDAELNPRGFGFLDIPDDTVKFCLSIPKRPGGLLCNGYPVTIRKQKRK